MKSTSTTWLLLRTLPVFIIATLTVVSMACSDAQQSTPAVDAGDDGSTADADAPVEYPGYCLAHLELDGNPGFEATRRAEYEDGRIVRDLYDSDNDGDDDRITTYTYDGELLVRLEIDNEADQTTDEIRTYDYDAEDRQIRETWDDDADGEPEMEIDFEHDSEGRRSRGIGQADEDPDPELVMEFSYGDMGLVKLSLDGLRGEPDDEPDRVIHHQYDEAGNLDTTQFDYDGDGSVDAILLYTYDCWE